MTRRNKPLQLLGVAIMLAGAFVALRPRVEELLTASSCLDQGGSYDYGHGQCDHEKSHPFIPWHKRSLHDRSVLVGGGLVVGGFLVVFLRQWPRRRQQQ